jgi:hypothetical protein
MYLKKRGYHSLKNFQTCMNEQMIITGLDPHMKIQKII